MLEMMTSMLDGFLKAGTLLPATWLSLGVCVTWYILSARRYAPLTPAEARILWKIHKQKVQCAAKECMRVERKNKLVGFQCECGYKHVQKRPIINLRGAS